ncbi:MogA/MoaB family molybdenum cofactor biosynthesis protein [Halopelagius longus]|uniref:Molybdenum cofactor biosynthesis protein B n=1 Tax=Halopelagius longus TaxID=1236180 RepID=A0A1H0YLJ6_9EURY|nr:molybdenum cofactor synthesis domain-containing protein [Halopelagius longus]RDI72549.1 molybdenum cofactor biosynthesis protein B [Halopelagius longus]SDQ15920.1 molybdenum cofactor biosynthesis protein B [Halopelagius longus]
MSDGPQMDADHEAAAHQDDRDGDEHHDEHDHDDHEHDHHHEHDVETVGVGVVTISSTRSLDDDPAGDAIVEAFDEAGHEVVTRQLVDDDFDGIQATVDNLVDREDVDVVVTTGGTGVTPDDVTVEAVDDVLRKRLPGFGELFRRLSYEEIGTRVVGTCAAAGVSRGVLIFCLPGSENAVRLGTEEIIVPEVSHLVGLASRDDEE